jgi:serpin B
MKNENSIISVANSIWFRETETLNVNREFLRDAKLYYGAGAYSSPFDGSTVDDINKWVSDNTNGMIPKMLDSISERELMILLNTVLLQARWNGEYSKDKITEKDFTTIDGIVKRVEMMSSVEKIYIETENAIGFMRNMSGYKFVAVLPNEDIGIEEYIASLDADEVRKILTSDDVRRVHAQLPKFKYDYSIDLKNILVNMGISHAFSDGSADFTRMAETVDKLYFSGIEHKTAIELDEQGIKAAAATAVKLYASAAPGGEKPQEVYVKLDRPFAYFIIDEKEGIPVFIGAVTDIGK